MTDNGKSRGLNFTIAELNQLCASWMHVSQDPIVGSGQTLKSFWERTMSHYNANRPSNKESRNIRSLESKWSDIKHDVAKFSGCFQAVLDKNHSGDSLEDTVRKSKELYVVKGGPKGKEFQFLDQWYLLRDYSRFAMTVEDMNQKSAQVKARKKKGKGRLSTDKENECPNVEGVIDLEDDRDAVVIDAQRDAQRPTSNSSSENLHCGEQRPLGNKAAKKLRGDEFASKVMVAAQRDMAAISAKRLKLAEKQDLENFLTLRVADLDPECQEYFKACRAKELRIAMAKLQREEEEELNALRQARQTPLPSTPSTGLSTTNVECETPSDDSECEPNPVDGGISFVEELARLDKDIVEGRLSFW